jgi:hypothetical protein
MLRKLGSGTNDLTHIATFCLDCGASVMKCTIEDLLTIGTGYNEYHSMIETMGAHGPGDELVFFVEATIRPNHFYILGKTVALPNRADFGSLGLVDEAEEVYRTESRLGFLA